MDDLVLLDAIERYLRNEIHEEERIRFEALRSQHAEIDQLVVEQHAFLNQLEHYGDIKKMKHQLQSVHNKLLEQQLISTETPEAPKTATVIEFWRRYKRTIGVAASIAGITALSISAAMQLFAPKAVKDLQNLSALS